MEGIELLEQALENENNNNILHCTKKSILEDKQNIIKDDKILEKLEEYRYISKPEHVNHGCYIRWIASNGSLVTGGIVCKINKDKETITVRNNRNRFFTCPFHKVRVFQKITEQEGLLLEIASLIQEKGTP